MIEPGQDATITEAKLWLSIEGEVRMVDCPCCTQKVHVYRRSIYGKMARALITMYHKPYDWIYVPSLGEQGGDLLKARWWGLLEPKEGHRDDGSRRTGFWRLTLLGRRYVLNEAKIVKYAYVFNNNVLRMDGPQVDIRDALGKKFDYHELMGQHNSP